MKILLYIVVIVILLGLSYFIFDYIRYYNLSKTVKDTYTISNSDKNIIVPSNDIKYYVINLPKNKYRLKYIVPQLEREKINYEIVEAINGKTYDREYIDKWPCLKKDEKYMGTKGLQLSNLKIFKRYENIPYRCIPEWIGIIEDDCEIPERFNLVVDYIINKYPKVKVINLDERGKCNENSYSRMTTSLMLYHKSVINYLIKELDYKRSVHMNSGKHKDKHCFFDWYLFRILKEEKIPMVGVPIIKSGKFFSTIDTSKQTGYI